MDMLCSRCHKRPAVVFISPTTSGESQGLCLVCAKELGIKPVTDLLDKMGINEEQLEAMASEFNELGFPAMNEDGENGPGEGEDGFEPGGAVPFPSFLQSIFPGMGNNKQQDDAQKNEGKTSFKEKREKKKHRHLDTYCTNLTARAAHGELDAIIGREKEISRVVQILSRRTKITPASSASPAWARPPLQRGWPSASPRGMFPHAFGKRRSIFWI